jgi:Domain of unknown function (DUF4430)
VRPTLRTATLAACLAALAAPAALWAAPLNTTIRVEGSAATTVPESAVVIDSEGTETLFSGASSITTARSSALWQLARAAQAAALPFAFSVFDLGGGPTAFVDQVGPDTGSASAFWIYKVDHVTPDVGAGARTLAEGDSVLWYFAGSDTARELDLAVSTDRVAQGQPFTATAVSYDAAGTPLPATGAAIRYGDTVALADDAGAATFVARGEGTLAVTATRAGDVRSPARAVCAYAGDPVVCNLPRLPATAAPAPASAAGAISPGGGGSSVLPADTAAPGSRMSFPRAGGRYLRVLALRGTAGPDRSDVSGVQAALAQRVGTLCRFRTATGSWTAPRACARQLYLKARAVGGDWLLPLRGRALGPGVYRAWSRATDGAGNREGVGLAGVNTMQFRILPRRA